MDGLTHSSVAIVTDIIAWNWVIANPKAPLMVIDFRLLWDLFPVLPMIHLRMIMFLRLHSLRRHNKCQRARAGKIFLHSLYSRENWLKCEGVTFHFAEAGRVV